MEEFGLTTYWLVFMVACAASARSATNTISGILTPKWRPIASRGIGTCTGIVSGLLLHYISDIEVRDFIAASIYGGVGGFFSDVVLNLAKKEGLGRLLSSAISRARKTDGTEKEASIAKQEGHSLHDGRGEEEGESAREAPREE